MMLVVDFFCVRTHAARLCAADEYEALAVTNRNVPTRIGLVEPAVFGIRSKLYSTLSAIFYVFCKRENV